MISKAIEKNCVSLLEMLFASVQITDTENLPEYISKFHRNISVGDKITVDDFISFTDAISKCGELLAQNFPCKEENPNELSDGLVILGDEEWF